MAAEPCTNAINNTNFCAIAEATVHKVVLALQCRQVQGAVLARKTDLNGWQSIGCIPCTHSLSNAHIIQTSEGTDVSCLHSLSRHSVEVVVHKELCNLACLWFRRICKAVCMVRRCNIITDCNAHEQQVTTRQQSQPFSFNKQCIMF